MNRWFRLYDEVLDDPKVQRLPPALFKAWINVLCAASRNAGTIPALADLAFMLRRDEAKVFADLAALEAAGLIDQQEGIVTPHNWSGRQFQSDSSTERVKRFRNGKRNGDGNGGATASATPPETEQSRTEAEPEKKDNLSNRKNGFAIPNVAGLIKRASKRAGGTRSSYERLSPDDKRLPFAQAWWHENYGSDLPVRHDDRGQFYHVPHEALR